MKQTIKLTESELHSLITESVKKILRENEWQKGSNYVTTDGYYNNGKGVERIDNQPNVRSYELRNTKDGYRNHDRISAVRGTGLSRYKYGNGGNDNGQL